jgi:hypothetical protein
LKNVFLIRRQIITIKFYPSPQKVKGRLIGEMMMREEINSELRKLSGLKLQYAGRASNLFWLGFGEMISVRRRKGTERMAEYSLHIQCSWRITKGNKIVVASRDFYYPRSDWDEENDDFDWDVQGTNRFDEKIKNFLEVVKGQLIVERIDSDDIGGIKVHLSDKYVLEAFPDNSEEDEYSEYWRFFNMKDASPHFVVGGNGIHR